MKFIAMRFAGQGNFTMKLMIKTIQAALSIFFYFPGGGGDSALPICIGGAGHVLPRAWKAGQRYSAGETWT
jgi:hypothetical protein